MIPYQFTYLTGTLISLLPWLIIFLLRKDLRRTLVVMSIIGGFVGLLTEYLWWTLDWWHPETFTGTRIGLEDFLLGFSNFGIISVFYQFAFKKKTVKVKSLKSNKGVITGLILFSLVSISTLHYVFGLTTYIAFILTSLVWLVVYAVIRRDLLPSALILGLITVLASTAVYFCLQFLSPGWIERTWFFNNLTGVVIAGIPLEDLLFYFFVGAVLSPVAGIWNGSRYK